MQLLSYSDIDLQAWENLIDKSPTATWFQTPEAYAFYSSVQEEMEPFCFAISHENTLQGVIIGYITKVSSRIVQFFSRRAIIIGGPLLDEHISDEVLSTLLLNVKKSLREVIYIETRNFNDYSRWKLVFEKCGFIYQPHLNFHVDTSSLEVIDTNLGKSRKRDVRTTIREGVTSVYQPTIEQVRSYYNILKDLYKTKVKTPLFKWEWFVQLYKVQSAHFILTELKGEIVGGTVCVELQEKAMYEWFACGIDGVYSHVYPSTYATYLGIKYAHEKGCKIFDMMGAGKPDEAYGVRDFKAKFGGELIEYGRYLCVSKPLFYMLGKLVVLFMKMR